MSTPVHADAHELELLRACDALNRETDALMERATRERWPLARTVNEAMPLLAGALGAAGCLVSAEDEDGLQRAFRWPASGRTVLPEADILAAADAGERFRVVVSERLVIGQPLDVAGDILGAVGVALPAAGVADEATPARLLDVWCEELDNYLAAIARARRKHRVSQAISAALRHPLLDQGIREGMAALRTEVDFDDMVLVYRHDDAGDGPSVGYKVWLDGALAHDSAAPDDPETDAAIRAEARKSLDGDGDGLLALLGIERHREAVLISGVRDEVVIGKLVAATRRDDFNTFDRDILERFADVLRQRVVDFNKDWRQLSQCFPRALVTRLLSEEDYATRFLDPVERDTAVMFCDLSGFTRVSEQVLHAPARIGELIDVWSAEVVRILWSTGGVFDKMVGDCIIGLWGPPFWDEEPADLCRRAARASQAIRDYTRRLPAQPGLEDLEGVEPPMGVATGLNWCPLFVGRFGPNEDYTGFSSGMNNAARLQGVAECDEILCMASFADLLGDGFALGEERRAAVKNVSEPLRYRLLLDG